MTQPDTKPQQTWRERFRKLFAMPKDYFDGKYVLPATPVADLEAFIATERTNVLKEVKALVEQQSYGEGWIAKDDLLAALKELEAQNE